ncbi:hypothetical protein DFQ28_004202 [Apophysomyces sp. BC1034]|nr:hypothetical protein DFQ30_004254 [Apophysomyces sp. BC1015]KAG0178495.1 hypothetical protein DFQ29_003403 [Apophysomyces sp. BC1021]KAG0188892.1 hypothetical protein DFQ28_004202 [Apophysomyces sp. BC1034]
MKIPASKRSSATPEASSPYNIYEGHHPTINEIRTPSDLLRILSRFPQLQSNKPASPVRGARSDDNNEGTNKALTDLAEEHNLTGVPSSQQVDTMLEFERQFDRLRRRQPQAGRQPLDLAFRRQRNKRTELTDYNDTLTEISYDTNTDFSEFSRLDHNEHDTQNLMDRSVNSFLGEAELITPVEDFTQGWQPPTPRQIDQSLTFEFSSTPDRQSFVSQQAESQVDQTIEQQRDVGLLLTHDFQMEETQDRELSVENQTENNTGEEAVQEQDHKTQTQTDLLRGEIQQQQADWDSMPDDFMYDIDNHTEESRVIEPLDNDVPDVFDEHRYDPPSRPEDIPSYRREDIREASSGDAFIQRRIEERLRDRRSELFFDQMVNDLQKQADHEEQGQITAEHVKKLMERQNILNSKMTFEALAHQHLPRELWDVMCTSALADNVLYPDSFD